MAFDHALLNRPVTAPDSRGVWQAGVVVGVWAAEAGGANAAACKLLVRHAKTGGMTWYLATDVRLTDEGAGDGAEANAAGGR